MSLIVRLKVQHEFLDLIAEISRSQLELAESWTKSRTKIQISHGITFTIHRVINSERNRDPFTLI